MLVDGLGKAMHSATVCTSSTNHTTQYIPVCPGLGFKVKSHTLVRYLPCFRFSLLKQVGMVAQLRGQTVPYGTACQHATASSARPPSTAECPTDRPFHRPAKGRKTRLHARSWQHNRCFRCFFPYYVSAANLQRQRLAVRQAPACAVSSLYPDVSSHNNVHKATHTFSE